MIISALCYVLIAKGGVEGSVVFADGKPAYQAVVFLKGGAKAQPLAKAVVDQRNYQFVPHISVVTVGTVVQFPNSDAVFHNVFAEFDAKRFDLGMYPRGAKKTQRFDKPGLVALLCSVHSEMSAYVMVVDTPYYAITNRKGRFSIPNATPGDYEIRVWHESGLASSQKLAVSDSTKAVEIVLKS